jgi:flagellar L-ring protein precursor FlgH
MTARTAVLLAVATLVGVGPAAPAGGGSIWAKANAGGYAPRVYEDDTARRVGDILTIVVNERSVIENETSREMDKSSKRGITAAGTVNLQDLPQWWGNNRGANMTLPTIGANSTASTDFEGNADFEAERVQTDRITVVVHDVQPNGNLVVVGSRRRSVHGDEQVVCISGIVRPSDITFANTVSSDQVADFHMVTLVRGQENGFTNPGWLGRILNWLSPW